GEATWGTASRGAGPAEPVRLLRRRDQPDASALDDAAGCFREQVRLNEAVEVAVEHSLRVADLVLGAMVLDELVRVQHVAADRVAAEAHVHVAALLGKLRFAFLLGLLGQA